MNLHQQYHFRQSDQGLLAWDVLKLIRLSRDVTVKHIPLSDIRELDENYWYGSTGDEPISKDIAKHAKQIYEADLSYPIILCSEGRIMDGMHRVCKALLEGHETIAAVQFDAALAPDYVGKMPDELPY